MTGQGCSFSRTYRTRITCNTSPVYPRRAPFYDTRHVVSTTSTPSSSFVVFPSYHKRTSGGLGSVESFDDDGDVPVLPSSIIFSTLDFSNFTYFIFVFILPSVACRFRSFHSSTVAVLFPSFRILFLKLLSLKY